MNNDCNINNDSVEGPQLDIYGRPWHKQPAPTFPEGLGVFAGAPKRKEYGIEMDGIAQMLGLDIFDYDPGDIVVAVGKLQSQLTDTQYRLQSALVAVPNVALAWVAPSTTTGQDGYYTPMYTHALSFNAPNAQGGTTVAYEGIQFSTPPSYWPAPGTVCYCSARSENDCSCPPVYTTQSNINTL
ncbi:hypothetical protein [Hymenobacter koreensis]|uniref:Uncharacterized protein n=1 Tax=Hymenobacter koreensis TaxID=1084523 RepID=A0ABP8JJK3_9BACT